MAFLLNCVIDDYEVRNVGGGTSKKSGKPYKTIKVEGSEGNSCEISCTDDALFYDVDKLQKGDIITCRVTAVSGKERSYITLRSAPVIKGNAYTGEVI